MQIAEDRWLTERFGHPVFSVQFEGDPGADAGAVLEHADGRAASYQARISAERPDATAALTGIGFQVVNVTITLTREPGPMERDSGSSVEVREADSRADRAVLEIAEHGLTRTRFHLDPAVPPDVAARVKRDWAENSLTGGRGDGMLVAIRDAEPIGFLAGLEAADGGRSARIIDLIAVAESARASGAGGAMASRFIDDAQGRFDELRVGTQAANPDATRFYERLGFTTVAAAYDLHLHTAGAWG